MVTQLRQRLLHLTVGWMLATVGIVSLFGAISLEYIYLLSLFGFHMIVKLVSPTTVRPRWRERLRWPILTSLAGVPVLIVVESLRVLPETARRDILSLLPDVLLV